MTSSEKKKIEKAIKYVERNSGATRRVFFIRNWRLTTARELVNCEEKAAKELGVAMYEPIIEYFFSANDEEKDILISILFCLYRLYALESVPAFLINVVLNDTISMKVRKHVVYSMPICFRSIPLNKIREIYSIKDFRLDILNCLPCCKDKERHEFAISLLNEQSNRRIINSAVHSLIAEMITPEEAKLLITLYSKSIDPNLRCTIIELLFKSSTDDLHDFFINAFKKERRLMNKLQAIIGLCIKSDNEIAEEIMIEFVNETMKREYVENERDLVDLRFMVEQLDEHKKNYQSKAIHFAYEALSSIKAVK